MSIEERQKEMDMKKWLKSEELGHDACGEFDYCSHCDKTNTYPCATAFDLFQKSTVVVGCCEDGCTACEEKKKTTKRASKKAENKEEKEAKKTAKKEAKKTTKK